MTINRESLIKKLSEETGFYQKDILKVFQSLDAVVLDYLAQATSEDEVYIQLIAGCKVGCTVLPQRERVNPRTQEKIMCEATCRPSARFSQNFKDKIQEQYEMNKDG